MLLNSLLKAKSFLNLTMGSLPSHSQYEPPLSSAEKQLKATYLSQYYFRNHYEKKYNRSVPEVILQLCIEILLTFEISKQESYDAELIYDSSQRGNCYTRCRILWCGCCEPYQRITTKYIKED
eukprot:536598_1